MAQTGTKEYQLERATEGDAWGAKVKKIIDSVNRWSKLKHQAIRRDMTRTAMQTTPEAQKVERNRRGWGERTGMLLKGFRRAPSWKKWHV